MKISSKITLLALTVIIINVAIQANILIDMKKVSIAEAENTFLEITNSELGQFLGKLSLIDKTVDDMRGSIEVGLKENSITRVEVIKLMHESLSRHNNIVGHGAVFEKNAFDNRDDEFKGEYSITGSDDDGRFVSYTYPAENGGYVAEPIIGFEIEGDGDWYLVPKRTNKPFITEPYLFPVGDEIVLMTTISYPVMNKDDTFIGVVTADIDINYLQEEISSIEKINSNDGYAILFTNLGTIVAYSHNPEKISSNIVEEESHGDTLETIKNYDFLSYSSEIGGRDHLSIIKQFPFEDLNSTWGMAIHIPEDKILEIHNKVFYSNVILVIILVIVISVSTIIMILHLVRKPLKLLEESTEAISKGDYGKSISLDSNDEFGALAVKFEKMREHILAYELELKRANEMLESKVEERTKELKETRDELIKTAEKTLTNQLIAGVTHEMGSPLGSALTMSTYVTSSLLEIINKTKTNSITKKDFEKAIASVLESSQAIQEYIEDSTKLVNHFKKLVRNKKKSVLQKFKIGTHIEDCLKLIQHDTNYVKIQTKVTYDEDLEIMSYPTAYFELIAHLVLFSIENCTLAAEKRVIEIDVNCLEDDLIILYMDSCLFIEDSNLENIFEPFFKTLKGKKQQDYSLPIVKSIVSTTLNGQIDIVKMKDEGIEFRLIIPMNNG